MNQKTTTFLITAAFVSMALLSVGAVALQLLTVQGNFGKTEGQQFEVSDDLVTWDSVDLSAGTYALENINISAGDYDDFFLNGTNNNKRPIQYTYSVLKQENVTFDVACNSSTGVEYAINDSDSTNYIVKVKNPALSSANIGIRTIVDAGAPTDNGTYPAVRQYSIDRREVEDITWSTCA